MFRVIVVDDQEAFRQLARALLEEGDFQVVAEASNGSAAVDLVAQVDSDLILMDVQMEPMNGFETTKRILEHHPNAKVVLVSIHGEKEYSRIGHEVGALAFIPKKELSLSTILQALKA